MKNENFFTEIGNTKPYFKAAFEGFAGAGKTFTASQLAIGLHKKIKSQKPIIIFDTEKAIKFLKKFFDESNIKVLVRESKSLADLKETMKLCREGLSDILLIDSISHVWEGFLESYKEKIKRASFQFQDWGIIKPTWKKEFSDPFVNDPYHIIMCGRAGYEYSYEVNEDTGKRELQKDGVKMKVEGETAYEPDILVLMNRYQEMSGGSVKKVIRTANIIKDRSTLLDGKVFENPKFEDFLPCINTILTDPVKNTSNAEKDSKELFKTEEDKREFIKEKKKWLEEIEGYLVSIWPGASAKEKKAKIDAIFCGFDTYSWSEVENKKLTELQLGYERIKNFVQDYINNQKQKGDN